jgi:hypothetical protein
MFPVVYMHICYASYKRELESFWEEVRPLEPHIASDRNLRRACIYYALRQYFELKKKGDKATTTSAKNSKPKK